MKRLLISGGAGFIGSNFICYMVGKYRDYQIINLDKLTYAANLENLKSVEGNSNYRFVMGDICDEELVDGLIEDCDVVINFAAETHVDRSINNSTDFIRTNVHGTNVLLEAARRHNTPLYIQISTDEVYGSRESGSFTEDDPLNPSNPYSASKAAADLLTRAYQLTHDLPTIIIRSTNNMGPYQFPEKMISLFITNTLENEPLPVYGDGKNVRDWLYVLDNCEAIDLILHQDQVGEIYNIGAGNEKTNLEVTHFILERLGKPKDLIKFVADRPGHDRRYALDWTRVRKLGWRPKHTFEEAIDKTIDWYQKNRTWWERIKESLVREDSGHWLKRDAWSRSL